MSNAVRRPERSKETSPPQGPSLKVVYTLVALALVAAIGFALLIVLPFYNRR